MNEFVENLEGLDSLDLTDTDEIKELLAPMAIEIFEALKSKNQKFRVPELRVLEPRKFEVPRSKKITSEIRDNREHWKALFYNRRIDAHTHPLSHLTYFSDGVWSYTKPTTSYNMEFDETEHYVRNFIEYLQLKVRRCGLEGVAITDHNQFNVYPKIVEALPKSLANLKIVPGMELSVYPPGTDLAEDHFLVYMRNYEDFALIESLKGSNMNLLSFKRTIDEVHSLGGIVCISHPRTVAQHMIPVYLDLVDGFEILNWNLLSHWDNQLIDQVKITPRAEIIEIPYSNLDDYVQVQGSDWHSDYSIRGNHILGMTNSPNTVSGISPHLNFWIRRALAYPQTFKEKEVSVADRLATFLKDLV